MTRALALAVTAMLATAAAPPGGPVPPLPEGFAVARLAGPWYEVAAYGSWAQRRCVRDTTFDYVVKRQTEIQVHRRCGVSGGVESQRGRIRSGQAGDPRWKARWRPAVLGWWPEAWSDHWVVAIDPGYGWYVAGDDGRGRLSVLSRTISIDEATMAVAIAAARAQGYDVDRLVRIPQGPGAFIR